MNIPHKDKPLIKFKHAVVFIHSFAQFMESAISSAGGRNHKNGNDTT